MATTGHELEAINVQGLKASLQKMKDNHIDTKVSDVSYNSSTGKLQKTVDGITSDVVTIVTSGFSLTEDDTNGLDTLAPIGSATITDDNTNGLDILTF